MGKNNRERRKEKKRAQAKRRKPQSKALGSTIERLGSFQEKYFQKWIINSEYTEREGHYAWMLSLVSGFTRLLEVGSGDGRTTVALAKAGHAVVAVEENPACLAATLKALAAAGVEHQVLRRVTVKADEHFEIYKASYAVILAAFPASGAVLLLEGDVANDPELEKWLLSVEPLDAVICWLIGTHGAQHRNEFYAREEIKTALEYRLRVQNAVYELAAKVLRPGGIVNIVDRGLLSRGAALDIDVKDHHAGHMDQARVTDLQVAMPVWRPYNEAEHEGRMKLIAQVESDEQAQELGDKDLVLLSVTATKPAV